MNFVTLQMENQDEIYGGSYQKYMELIAELLARGFTVHHISPAGFKNIEDSRLVHHGLRSPDVKPKYLLFLLGALKEMMAIKKSARIDAVITFSAMESMPGVAWKFIVPNTRLITAFHGDAIAVIRLEKWSSIRKFLSIQTYKIIERIALKYSDRTIFVSEYTRNNILSRHAGCKVDNTHVIYNSSNSRKTIEQTKYDKIFFGDSKFVIGFVGSLFREGKGLGCLLKAYCKIASAIPDTILVIVGQGPDEEELKMLADEYGLGDRVVFAGYRNNPAEYIKSFDLLVLPSLHEACPLVILESLFVNTPVLGSRVGGITEILKYDELLFPAEDADALAERLLGMAANRARYANARSLCACRRDAFMFDWGAEMIKTII